MNTLPLPVGPAAPRLTLDVVADFTCPWSFLGLRRVGRALGNLYGLPTPPLMRWHGFRMPRERSGEGAGPQVAAWRAHLATRLPSGIAVDFAERSLAEAGAELGIAFDFDRIAGVPDTTAAHRLTLIAAREGRLASVVDGIFRAYFEQGRDIADGEELLAIGRAAGLSAAGLQALADPVSELEALGAEEQRLRSLGVANVPNLLLNGRVLVPGAADVDTYVLALDQALFPDTGGESATRRLLN
jgi:predicted DsbA family dithiol-disulfide isomerase